MKQTVEAKDCWGYVQLLVSFVLLFIGGGIYVLFRNKSLILFQWFDALNLGCFIDDTRRLFADTVLNDFVLYSLPDGLWLMSYMLIADVVVPKSNKYSYLFWVSLLPVFAIVNELLQATHLVKGYFDKCDLICYLLSISIFLIIKKTKL